MKYNLQCVTFRCPAKWFSYTYICLYLFFFQILSPYKLLQNTKYGFLCYTNRPLFVIYFICSSVYRDVQCREDKAPADYAQLVEVISGHFGVNPFKAWFNCVSWKLRVLNESWVLCWGWELMLRKSSIVLAIMEFTVQGTRQISKYSTMRWLQVNESSTYTME